VTKAEAEALKYLESDISSEIEDFKKKASSWMRVATISNLRSMFELSEESANKILDIYLSSEVSREKN
jgi:hypothetical protein